MFVRLLLHWRSAAGWAECIVYSALVYFSGPYIFLIAEGDVSPGFGAGRAAAFKFICPYVKHFIQLLSKRIKMGVAPGLNHLTPKRH